MNAWHNKIPSFALNASNLTNTLATSSRDLKCMVAAVIAEIFKNGKNKASAANIVKNKKKIWCLIKIF